MKKYLIALAAMAVAVSSCTEKMSSGDNSGSKEDNNPENTRLVKTITQSLYESNGDITSEYEYTFTYDSQNRIVGVNISSYDKTWSMSYTYTENTLVIENYDGWNGFANYIFSFDNGKLTSSRIDFHNAERDDRIFTYLYEGNNSKPSVMKEGNWETSYVWDDKGNLIQYSDDDLHLIYTGIENKCNIQLENFCFNFFGIYAPLDRNVFSCIANKELLQAIGQGSSSPRYTYSYKLD